MGDLLAVRNFGMGREWRFLCWRKMNAVVWTDTLRRIENKFQSVKVKKFYRPLPFLFLTQDEYFKRKYLFRSNRPAPWNNRALSKQEQLPKMGESVNTARRHQSFFSENCLGFPAILVSP